eukprot:4942095-Pleurochrysis_carterae.AAC.1
MRVAFESVLSLAFALIHPLPHKSTQRKSDRGTAWRELRRVAQERMRKESGEQTARERRKEETPSCFNHAASSLSSLFRFLAALPLVLPRKIKSMEVIHAEGKQIRQRNALTQFQLGATRTPHRALQTDATAFVQHNVLTFQIAAQRTRVSKFGNNEHHALPEIAAADLIEEGTFEVSLRV